MVKSPNPTRARAEAAFRTVTPEEKQTAMHEYRAREQAEREKMASAGGAGEKTAKALGLIVPATLLARADEVIE